MLSFLLFACLGQESITVAVTPPTQKYTVVLKAAKPPAGAFTVWNIYPRAGIDTLSRSTTEWKLLAPPGGTFEAVRSVATSDGALCLPPPGIGANHPCVELRRADRASASRCSALLNGASSSSSSA